MKEQNHSQLSTFHSQLNEVPAGYKQTEVGVIPEDWKVSTIGSEFEVKLGKMLDADKNIGIEKPYLGNKSVQWGFIDVQNLPTMRMTPTDLKAFRLNVGDLLVCEGGEVGRSAIWEGEIEECYYQKALHRLRSLHGFKPSLMSAYFRYWTDQRLIDDYVSQTSIAHLTREKLISIPLPIPSAPEQTAIANALSDVDALIAALEKLINKKSAIKTAAMQQLLTGKKRLPPFDQLNTGYKQTELGEIPGDWEIGIVKDIAHVDPDNLDSTTSSDYEFEYISLEQVSRGVLAGTIRCVFQTAPSRARRVLKKGDVLIATVRPNLMSHYFVDKDVKDLVCSTGFSVVRSCENILCSSYLYQHLFSSVINNQIERMILYLSED